MITYRPMARIDFKPDNEPFNKLFTYDSVFTLAEATYQFFTWSNWYRYKIIHAWIDVYDGTEKIDTIEYYKDEDACRRADELEQKERDELKRQRAEHEQRQAQMQERSREAVYKVNESDIAAINKSMKSRHVHKVERL